MRLVRMTGSTQKIERLAGVVKSHGRPIEASQLADMTQPERVGPFEVTFDLRHVPALIKHKPPIAGLPGRAPSPEASPVVLESLAEKLGTVDHDKTNLRRYMIGPTDNKLVD